MQNLPLIISKKDRLKQNLTENEILLLDINSIYNKAIKNKDKKIAIWNLRVVNSSLLELKNNIDLLINSI